MGKNYNYVWVAAAASLRCKMAADYTKMALAIIAVDRIHLDWMIVMAGIISAFLHDHHHLYYFTEVVDRCWIAFQG